MAFIITKRHHIDVLIGRGSQDRQTLSDALNRGIINGIPRRRFEGEKEYPLLRKEKISTLSFSFSQDAYTRGFDDTYRATSCLGKSSLYLQCPLSG